MAVDVTTEDGVEPSRFLEGDDVRERSVTEVVATVRAVEDAVGRAMCGEHVGVGLEGEVGLVSKLRARMGFEVPLAGDEGDVRKTREYDPMQGEGPVAVGLAFEGVSEDARALEDRADVEKVMVSSCEEEWLLPAEALEPGDVVDGPFALERDLRLSLAARLVRAEVAGAHDGVEVLGRRASFEKGRLAVHVREVKDGEVLHGRVSMILECSRIY
jgi:hypothetical protein